VRPLPLIVAEGIQNNSDSPALNTLTETLFNVVDYVELWNYGFENLLITLEMAEVVTQLPRNSYRSEFILLTQLACYFFPPKY